QLPWGELGADDVLEDDGYIEIIGGVETFKAINDSLHGAGIKPEEAGLRMVPQQEMELDKEQTISLMRVIEMLEESDDVQNVYTNLKISDEALAAMEED
ncbi:MAG: YebC/PmpR family DNA-binding transcriptional regulator, partial [Anaerolineaceae bacterium]|nr:YebC/PmpR family DNA-binding transcriptional regulator [Anaerolineaceae bacterium]